MAAHSMKVNTSLPLGDGAVSCDMLVVAHAQRVHVMFACSDPEAVELLHAPEFPIAGEGFSDGDLTMAEAYSCVRWANAEIKRMHICKNCSVSEAGGPMEELIMTMLDMTRLHPCAVPIVRQVSPSECSMDVQNEASPERVNKEREGVVVRLSRASQGAGPALARWTLPISTLSGAGLLNLPMPVPRTSGGTVNTTIMLIGDALQSCFLHKAHLFERPSADTHTGSSNDVIPFPEWMAVRSIDASKSNIIYLPPMEPRLTHGLSCVFPWPAPPERPLNGVDLDGRFHVGLNGCRVWDRTMHRLVICAEVSMATVPLLCGCVIRNAKRFERAHIPVIFAPSMGIQYDFRDKPDGRI